MCTLLPPSSPSRSVNTLSKHPNVSVSFTEDIVLEYVIVISYTLLVKSLDSLILDLFIYFSTF